MQHIFQAVDTANPILNKDDSKVPCINKTGKYCFPVTKQKTKTKQKIFQIIKINFSNLIT